MLVIQRCVIGSEVGHIIRTIAGHCSKKYGLIENKTGVIEGAELSHLRESNR